MYRLLNCRIISSAAPDTDHGIFLVRRKVKTMFCNNGNNSCFWIIIILLILFCGCGNGCGCSNNNDNGCGCGCGCN